MYNFKNQRKPKSKERSGQSVGSNANQNTVQEFGMRGNHTGSFIAGRYLGMK